MKNKDYDYLSKYNVSEPLSERIRRSLKNNWLIKIIVGILK